MNRLISLVVAFLLCASPALAQSMTGAALSPATVAKSSVIKMIQQGSVTVASSASSGTYTISPAITTLGNAILIINGYNTTSTGGGIDFRDGLRLTLTNATTLTATRGASASFAVTYNFTIIEFNSGVNHIHAADIVITAGSGSTNTASETISGSNPFVIPQGVTMGSSVGATVPQATLTLSGTTVTATVLASATITQTVRYMLVDLDTTIITSAQQKAVSMASSTTSDTDTLGAAVVLNNAAIMFGGVVTQGSSTIPSDGYSTYLTNTTTVTKTRSGTGSTARTVAYTVVEFAASCLNSAVQRNSTFNLSSQASNTAAISNVNTAKAFVNWTGFWSAGTIPNVTAPATSLTNGTTVTATLNSSGSATVPFEVVEFK